LSKGSYSDRDIDQGTKYVDSLNIESLLQDTAIDFEGDLDIAESLLSVSRLGRYRMDSKDSETSSCYYSTEETEKKKLALPYCQRIGYRILDEQSWCSSSMSSISDNNFYDADYVKGSNAVLKSMGKELDVLKEKDKVLNISAGKCLATYVGQFQTYKHRTACVIPDITIMDNMNIVLIDHYHNSIQLFSKEFKSLDEKVCSYPIGLSKLDDNHVVVTLRRTGQLAIFRINKTKLFYQRSIRVKCDSYLWQVTYKSSKLFVVCDENNVHVIGLDGQELNVIRSGVSPELGYLRYFDVNDKDRQIYVNERRGLRCINFKGKFQWLFTNEDFPESERDSRGHSIEDVCYFDSIILATHWTLNKIFQISLSGKFLRNIIVDNLEHPRILSILATRLVVTQFNPANKSADRSIVKIFEIDDLSKS
jgi:hypothetical protein